MKNALRSGKSVFLDGLDDVQELDLGRESVTMEDEGHSIRSIPTIELDATTARSQRSRVRLNTALAAYLVPHQVPVQRQLLSVHISHSFKIFLCFQES